MTMRRSRMRRRYGRSGGASGGDLYSKLKAIGAQMDHHESDLYVRATPAVERLVKDSRLSFSYFTDSISRERWIDVPFAYTPWWAGRTTRR